RCGGQGCVEAYVSDRAIQAEASALGFDSLAQFAASARDGSCEARDVYVRMGRLLGVGAKNVVNLLNPEAIVLGGERMEDSDLFLDSFLQELRRHAFSHETRELKVVPAELGSDGFLIGAGTLVTEGLFQQPAMEVAA
ncbi:MAG: ROK family protein, partial [Candidatus Bipolaricaulota bacterium]